MKSGKIITFSSSKNKVGKTFIVKNLACSLAEEGKKVLILDLTCTEEYMNFFNFNKYIELSTIYKKQQILQSAKLIYSKNRKITIIKDNSIENLTKKDIIDFVKKIKKTYDYILIENQKNIPENFNEYISKNIIIIEPELSSIKEINKIINNNKNNEIVVNKIDYSSDTGKLINLEDLFKMTDIKFLGIIDYTNESYIKTIPVTNYPYTNLNLSFNKISKRIINNSFLEKISNLNIKNKDFSLELLYKNFTIIKKNNF